ncbi:hypothetical protein W97_09198 [Coniosporium apollinis CBS 100218]|uniref:Methyltransferase domain-containing protein n=1 Tax=Coniosporium apollinis (strain CBS 100218) TaxID=1168221 RepID=R7Z746_CONA1|nr:uncharacterized protein W97_09198 [Coniosporium apollinis CBS 100218]EON69933.1 hypothetical protein W97_09198 [Coniosporium apollinis CBS 100218]
MTQPTSLNATFDTSLIDLSPPSQDHLSDTGYSSTVADSFSTTSSDQPVTGQPSGAFPPPPTEVTTPTLARTPKAPSIPTLMSGEPPATAPSGSSGHPKPVKYVPTVDAYDAWASVYDSDGNILQAVDDLELSSLLPEFLNLVTPQLQGQRELRITDLGCGTGRNTLKLAAYDYLAGATAVRVTGVDASGGMLEVARRKFAELPPTTAAINVTAEFAQYDLLSPASGSALPQQAHAVISTLVLEHIPLSTFFNAIRALLLPGGMALVTNMHPQMGGMSQAGFVAEDGTKVRGTSWVYGVEETVQGARAAGLELVGEVRERSVSEEMVESGVVGKRGRKWVGVRVWYGFVVRRIG